MLDPFGGSGTTLLAGQRIGCRVRAIELAPAYVDLAVARWRQNHPDLPVTLDGDGRDYDTIANERAETGELADQAGSITADITNIFQPLDLRVSA